MKTDSITGINNPNNVTPHHNMFDQTGSSHTAELRDTSFFLLIELQKTSECSFFFSFFFANASVGCWDVALRLTGCLSASVWKEDVDSQTLHPSWMSLTESAEV